MQDIAQSLIAVRRRMADAEQRFGRPAGSVALLAVSKTRPAEDIEEAARAGQQAFGENYAQEALGKIAALTHLALEWHFIGPIQTNKTRLIAEHFQWVHSVDRLKVARRLSEQRPEALGALDVCLEVNISGEATKAGVSAADAPALAAAVAALPGLRLRGLMVVPAPSVGFEEQRRPFRELRGLLGTLNATGFRMDTLSMGMSADLEAAIAEGATIVRVGTGIFGLRL
jgi:pyridoxal phosphate enzyme (YggS family)